MVQVGKVHAMGVHKGIRAARVKFYDTDIISDWLYCIDNRTYEVNTVVVCLYPAHFNSEGFVLGRLVDGIIEEPKEEPKEEEETE